VGGSAAELCTQKRQMLGNVLARRIPPTPLIGLNSDSLDTSLSPANLRLGPAQNHAEVAECHISCVGTHVRSRQGHPWNTPSQTPPPNPTLQHQIIMQELLKLWKAAGLEQVWGRTIFLPKGCKMVPGWLMACALRPHLAFSHTA